MGNFFESGLGQAVLRGVGAVAGAALGPTGSIGGFLGSLGPAGGVVARVGQTFAGGLAQGATGTPGPANVPFGNMIPQGGGVGNAGIATPVSFSPTGPPVLPVEPSAIQSFIPGAGPGAFSPVRLALSGGTGLQPMVRGVPSPPGRPGVIGVNGARVIGRVISVSGDFVKKILYWPSEDPSKARGPVWGAGIFNAAGELVGKDPSWRPTRRMNVLNPSALKRSMRRLSGFQTVIKDAVGMIECLCPPKRSARKSKPRCPPRRKKCA